MYFKTVFFFNKNVLNENDFYKNIFSLYLNHPFINNEKCGGGGLGWLATRNEE